MAESTLIKINDNIWIKTPVRGDGTCGYHSIMTGLKLLDNTLYNKIILYWETLLTTTTKLKNKGFNKNYNIHRNPGNALREYIHAKLKNLNLELTQLNTTISNNKLNLQSRQLAEEKYNRLISLYCLDPGFKNETDDRFLYPNNNKKEITTEKNMINLYKKKTRDYTIAGSPYVGWIDNPMIQIISYIIKMNIFIYDVKRKKWKAFITKTDIKNENTLFLFFTGGHYEYLTPTGPINKKKNNIPSANYFNFNFLS
jgi:hypothetical protein